jgi:hypothetical protein
MNPGAVRFCLVGEFGVSSDTGGCRDFSLSLIISVIVADITPLLGSVRSIVSQARFRWLKSDTFKDLWPNLDKLGCGDELPGTSEGENEGEVQGLFQGLTPRNTQKTTLAPARC